MKTKEKLGKKEIEAIRALSAQLRDVNCEQEPRDIKADLHSLATPLYNLTLEGQFETEKLKLESELNNLLALNTKQ